MDETIIKIENAALKLKKFMIKPANLEIPKGYIVGVQGENGAGKTTLLHMMLGMYRSHRPDCDRGELPDEAGADSRQKIS